MADDLLTFDEFREQVGASHHRVRSALLALRIRPIPRDPRDARRTGYKREWVAQVREWIERLGDINEQ